MFQNIFSQVAEQGVNPIDSNLSTPIDFSLKDAPVSSFGEAPEAPAPAIFTTDDTRDQIVKDQDELAVLAAPTTEEPKKRDVAAPTVTFPPKTMYKPDGTTTKVYDENNYNNLINAGWSETPPTGKDGEIIDTGDSLIETIDLADSQIDQELEAFNNLIDNRITQLDDQTQSTINSIKGTFDTRRSRMREINKNTLAALTTMGIRAGRQRYSPEIQASILSAEERAGAMRIAELDAMEAELINAANNANVENDFQLLNLKLEKASEARKEKRQAILDLHKMAMDEERLAIEKEDASRRQLEYLLKLSAAERDEIRFTNEIVDRVTEDVVPLVSNMLGDSAEKNVETIRKFAEDNDIPFETLYGEIQEYQDAQEERALDLQKTHMSILQAQSGIRLDNMQMAKLSADIAKINTDIQTKLNASTSGLMGLIGELPTGQQGAAVDAVASFKTGSDIIKLIEGGVKTGPLTGRNLTGMTLFGAPITLGKQAAGRSTKEQDELLSAMTAFSAAYIKSISGVAVSEQEYKRLMNALPSINRQENVNINSIRSLLNTLKNKYEFQLGVNFEDYPDDIPTDVLLGTTAENEIESMSTDYNSYNVPDENNENSPAKLIGF